MSASMPSPPGAPSAPSDQRSNDSGLFWPGDLVLVRAAPRILRHPAALEVAARPVVARLGRARSAPATSAWRPWSVVGKRAVVHLVEGSSALSSCLICARAAVTRRLVELLEDRGADDAREQAHDHTTAMISISVKPRRVASRADFIRFVMDGLLRVQPSELVMLEQRNAASARMITITMPTMIRISIGSSSAVRRVTASRPARRRCRRPWRAWPRARRCVLADLHHVRHQRRELAARAQGLGDAGALGDALARGVDGLADARCCWRRAWRCRARARSGCRRPAASTSVRVKREIASSADHAADHRQRAA